MFSRSIAVLAILAVTGVQASPAPVAGPEPVAHPDAAAASASKLSAASVVPHWPDTPQRSGGLLNSCNDLDLQYYTDSWDLSAVCHNGAGKEGYTFIRLGSCVGNSDGELIYEKNGAFGNSCDQIMLGGPNGAVLFGRCRNKSGGRVYSNIDLNSIIGNSGGKLVC